jgi:hypothetical protein
MPPTNECMLRIEIVENRAGRVYVEVTNLTSKPSVTPTGQDPIVLIAGSDPKVVCVDELPDYIKRKLAVLNTVSADPPTAWVDNIGRRINEDIFWVFKDKQDEDIDDSGKES